VAAIKRCCHRPPGLRSLAEKTLLIEAPIGELATAIATAQQAMKEASELVLAGFALRSDVKTILYPNRYEDDRGRKMWEMVQQVLGELLEGRKI
jgi:hypothetical protein